MGRTALPPPVGDVEVDLDWPGYPLVAVLRDSQSQCHLVRTEEKTQVLGGLISVQPFHEPKPYLLV